MDFNKPETPTMPEDAEAAGIVDELGAYVFRCFEEARDHRSAAGIDNRMSRCLRMKNMEHHPEDADLVKDVPIHMGIAALKSRAAASWITDILLNSSDKPFTVKPSPNPELPEWMKDQIVDILESEIVDLGASEGVRERAKNMKEAALKYVQEQAERAAKNMERKIEDQLVESNWHAPFNDLVNDITVFPCALMRSPIVEKVKRSVWNGDTVEVKDTVVLRSRRINPFDAYPSPDASDTQSGHYFIEVARLHPNVLANAKGMFGFIDENLEYVLEQYRLSGFELTTNTSDTKDDLENKNQALTGGITIDTIIYNGKIEGQFLIDNGVMVPDPQAYYEAEVYVVNQVTLRAVLNPHPEDRRPVHATSYVKVPGSFWGQSLIEVVEPAERMCHAAIRTVVKNMSFSAGPIGEYNLERLADGASRPGEVTPFTLYPVKDDFSNNSNPVFRWQVIPSVAPQAQAIFEYYLKYADDLSGVPAYVMGSPQVAGAGRTMGGLSMLMGNAAKGIKNVMLNIDRDVIEPIISYHIDYNMNEDPDPSIKGDSQAVARGSSGLLQRELAQTRTVEVLQLLAPFAAAVPPQGMQVLLREVLKGTGMNVDDIIPDPLRGRTLARDLGDPRLGEAMDRGAGQPVPLPPQSVPPQTVPTPVNLPQGA